MRKVQVSFVLTVIFCFTLVGISLSYYYPPTHIPPGPPPNYTQIDTSYFLGTPSIPMPPPDSGGIYIWYDQGMWQIANHIYSVGVSHEQFHCAILATLDEPPTLNVNVFIEQFEFWGDTTKSLCLKENDRWGWKPWGENLYEIWWDVTTRHGKEGDIDPNDFLKITIVGDAVDFNLWSSGMGSAFGPHEIFLGANKTPLSSVPEYSDFFPGISDPYQSQAGSDPSNSPNITIFTKYSDTLRTYNNLGLIDSTDSYTCELAVDYGQRYAGTFAYEGNGVQFSANAIFQVNNPPDLQVPNDTSYLFCAEDWVTFEVCATDPDLNDTLILEKVSGPGTFPGGTGISPLCDTLEWYATSDATVEFVFKVTDRFGLTDEDTVIVTVDLNDPPQLTVPDDFDTLLCDTTTFCFDITLIDPNDNAVVEVEEPGYYVDNSVCFPAYQEMNYCLEIVATDDCGESDTAEVCINVSFSDPPVVDAPAQVFVPQEQTVQFTFTASDPDGETLNDEVGITVDPDCGQYSAERIAGGGTSSGEWRLTFEATDCAVGFHNLVVKVQDACGKTGVDTTILGIQPRVNNAPVVTVPQNLPGVVGDTITYNAEAYDPDDDVLLDDANITLVPDCGSLTGVRLTGSGTSSGVWEITFYTLGCDSGSYQAIVEIEDTPGAVGAGTTYVALAEKGPSDVNEESLDKIAGFSLKQSYPNPFNPVCNIEYALPVDCHVILTVYNILGQKVKVLVNEYQSSGHKSVQWDGKDDQNQDVSSGIYFYRVQAGDFFQLKKMVLLK